MKDKAITLFKMNTFTLITLLGITLYLLSIYVEAFYISISHFLKPTSLIIKFFKVILNKLCKQKTRYEIYNFRKNSNLTKTIF